MKAVAYVRSFVFLAIIGQGVVACAGDATAPTVPGVTSSQAEYEPSRLSPSANAYALVGAEDGRYTFTVDPQNDESLRIGPNHLEIPSNSICRIGESSYGPGTWDDRCRTERDPVTITAVVTGANTSHPRIDFEPALRFQPGKRVMLYMTLDAPANKAEWTNIFYCATDDKSDCVDESLDDPTLLTMVWDRIVYRRIKHFSGYIVLSRDLE